MVVAWPEPKNESEVWRFLGFVGYYQKFNLWYAITFQPLTELTKHGMRLKLNEKCKKDLLSLKESLQREPILLHGDPDLEYHVYKTSFICTYATSSIREISGFFAQGHGSGQQPVQFESGLMTEVELNY